MLLLVPRQLNTAGTLRCMKYGPDARLRPPLIGVAVVKVDGRWHPAKSCASSQGFSLRLAMAKIGRSEQRASALSNLLLAVLTPEVVAGFEES
jgi:hypothetical protein